MNFGSLLLAFLLVMAAFIGIVYVALRVALLHKGPTPKDGDEV